MKWCCLTFKSWYQSAGGRGITVLVGRNSTGGPEFVLQHRSIDKEISSLPVTDYPISVVSDTYISFCPWCGRDLARWYRKHIDELHRPEFKVPPV